MPYTCPVCGYDNLEDPPSHHEICPSCGTQFGYHDFTRSHESLRLAWISKHMPWHSAVDEKPVGWNALVQLSRANMLNRKEMSALWKSGQLHHAKTRKKTQQSAGRATYSNLSVLPVRQASITAVTRWIDLRTLSGRVAEI